MFLGKGFFKNSTHKLRKNEIERRIESNNNLIKKKYKQIGKVMNEDGSVIVYYKTELGKIVFEVED